MTWVGLLLPSRRLLSAMLPVSLSINVLWTIDAATTVAGVPLSGMTAHIVDPAVPLPTRIAGWFHAVHPVAMLLIVRRIGYHPQGLWLAIAEVVCLLAGLRVALDLGWLPTDINPNWIRPEAAWNLPPWLASWPYTIFQILCLTIGMVLPVHLMLRRICRPVDNS